MSMDNGVYILRTGEGEYRVAECFAIDNLFYNNKTGRTMHDPDNHQMVRLFGRSEVFHDEISARTAAKQIESGLPLGCEYNTEIFKTNKPFPITKN